MIDRPRFTIMIPAFNAAATLSETVESVRSQTFECWELVIVDDGSTDETLAVAQALAADDPRIRVVSQSNRGTGGAYNTAVRTAASDLLVMLSADDLLLPHHLATYEQAIVAAPEASVFTSGGYFEYEDGSRVAWTSNTRWSNPTSCSMRELLRECFMGVGAVFRRQVFEAVGGFPEGTYAEDYRFWLSALARGFRHRYVDEVLAVHRRNSQQKSSATIRMRKADADAVSSLLSSGVVTVADKRAAVLALWRLRLIIAVRSALAALLGSHGADRLIDRMRGRA